MAFDRPDFPNPYSAPKAQVADVAVVEFQPVQVFSLKGRIGRVRYIGYSVGLTMLIGIVGVVVMGMLAMMSPAIGFVGVILMWGGIVAVQVVLTVQRCHDFNVSGWLALASLIPLVALIFWVVPGTPGENRYGNPTPPNLTLSVVLACVVPVVLVLGIVAAVAIPAYSDYTKRAKAAAPAK